MKKESYTGYYFWRKLCLIVGNIVFLGRVEGKENIPKEGKCILAGNHTGNFDAYLLFKTTKRPIHIIAKKELFDGPFKWLFKMMHLIPVDRKNKNPEAKNKAIEVLNNEQILGIFPEGTFHKNDLLLPFKPGVISFAEKANASIIPFAILGKFKLWGRPKIIVGKPININTVKEDKLKYLENIIKELIINNNKKI